MFIINNNINDEILIAMLGIMMIYTVENMNDTNVRLLDIIIMPPILQILLDHFLHYQYQVVLLVLHHMMTILQRRHVLRHLPHVRIDDLVHISRAIIPRTITTIIGILHHTIQKKKGPGTIMMG
jgi:hypothetical protein